ncbi:interleukin-20 receptor subunit alpha [Spinachia spinachia]
MWTVLIFLNLGAVHCTVSSSSLPSPINVTFSSVNLWNKLQWFPGSDTPEYATFEVQYAIYGDRVKPWRAVPRCTGIARNWCDLTDETRDLEDEYFARVRAASRTQSSPWAATRRFHPKADTSFGPPHVSVEIGDGNAIITLEGPMRYQPNNHTPAVSMATLYPQMTYMLSVENTRRGTTLRVPMNSNWYKYQLMEYDTEYCFSATTKFLSMPAQCLPSAPLCIRTPQDPVIGQLLRVVVGIVVPCVCICTVAVVGYLLHNYLTGKGQMSPYLLNLPAFHPPVLAFHPESPSLMVVAIIQEIQPESAECSKRQQDAPQRLPGYASQGRQILPQPQEPSGDWPVEYGCVVVSPEVPAGGEDGKDLSGGDQKCAAVDSYKKKQWNFEEEHSAGRTWTETLAEASAWPPTLTSIQGAAVREDGGSPGLFVGTTPRNGRCRVPLNPPTREAGMWREGGEKEAVPLLSAGSTDAPSFAPDRSGRFPSDYGVPRPASENDEQSGSVCLDWNPDTGKLVLLPMDGLMQGETEEEEEEEELRLENVFVRQGSEEKAEARREMEGGGGTGWEVEDFSNRWNLVFSMD